MTAGRDRWREFITSPDHAGRFMSRIGGAVRGALSEPIHMDELQDFLASLSSGEADVEFLAGVVELLSGGHRAFVRKELPVLLDQLSSETSRENRVVGPAVTGSVRWMETRVARRTGRLPPGRYVSITARRSYDIPENRTIRRYLEAVDQVATGIVKRAPSGRAPRGIEALLREVRHLQTHDAMRGLRVDGSTDEVDVQIAETSGRRGYETVAALLRSLDRIAGGEEDTRRHSILMLLAVGWLEPLDDDDLFELYVLVLVLDLISKETCFGPPIELALVRSGRTHIARYASSPCELRVFFDTSLARIVGRRGRYVSTIDAHSGLTGRERRPDVVLALTDRNDKSLRVLIVEAKRSDDGRYLSDSVYKVFGYLHDFGGVVPDLHAMLAVPETVTRLRDIARGEITVVAGDDRRAMSHAILDFVRTADARSDREPVS